MTGTNYNGWKNYETWLCNLWMTNDEGWYSFINEMAEEIKDVYEFSLFLSDQVKEMIPETTGFVADLLTASIERIDFYEIAENWIAE